MIYTFKTKQKTQIIHFAPLSEISLFEHMLQ